MGREYLVPSILERDLLLFLIVFLCDICSVLICDILIVFLCVICSVLICDSLIVSLYVIIHAVV